MKSLIFAISLPRVRLGNIMPDRMVCVNEAGQRCSHRSETAFPVDSAKGLELWIPNRGESRSVRGDSLWVGDLDLAVNLASVELPPQLDGFAKELGCPAASRVPVQKVVQRHVRHPMIPSTARRRQIAGQALSAPGSHRDRPLRDGLQPPVSGRVVCERWPKDAGPR
jgi:hypothetical protein